MDVVERIAGSEKLLSIFGYWPSFHDAEVLWMRLDRHPHGEGNGPTLEVLVHAFEMTSEINPEGYYVLRHQVLVHMQFREIVELTLDGFNIQNVLWGIEVSALPESLQNHRHFDVRFDSSYGVQAAFQCKAVEIVAVTPCTEKGEPIDA
ncbi:MAG TPA: Imm50 family immunity protein [Gemmataceae bacterium]|nr:Imm50 family immunity protein [Gemmataceae bacterium]